MGVVDILLLAAVAAGLFFAVRGGRKSPCCGDCAACAGCRKRK